MRRLYTKIFIWFLVAITLLGGALISLAFENQSEYAHAQIEQNDMTLTPPFADRWATVFERQGKPGLSQYRAHASGVGIHTYFFGADGSEVFGAASPKQTRLLVQNALQTDQTLIVWTTAHRFVAQRATGPSGNRYVLLIDLPSPLGLLFDLPSAFGSALVSRPEVQVFRLILIALVGALVCFWLARYITGPVGQLQSAVRQLADGNLNSRVGSVITHRKDELADLGRDFNRMAERIESLMVSQQRLLRNVSHELRSPLSRLTVALDLAHQDSDPAIRGYLDRIAREANLLNNLIESLLKLARLESRTEPLDQTTVELDALVCEVAADVDFEARSRGCGVRVTSLQPCIVYGVRDLLHSAIENIVRNGAAYTKKGTEIEVSLARALGSGQDSAVIHVRDFGEGVPGDDLDTIFKPFYRTADARERSSGGFGLGLTITAEAVRLHGGQVRAENCLGGGLLVEVTLPLSAKKEFLGATAANEVAS
jgi:two-component system sensor histidine kinase CpxA